ncbi:MAG: hypothetical protein C4308_03540 [Chitinophagaceae bacterium]
MQIIIEGVENPEQSVECFNCSWEGKLKELKKGELLELNRMTELFCPQCNKYLGFVQHAWDNEH